MIYIPMGGADIVLGVQWLQSLGMMAFNFHKLFMKFSWKENKFVLSGIIGKSRKVINSNGIKQLLKQGK